jgi:hypothetical protein
VLRVPFPSAHLRATVKPMLLESDGVIDVDAQSVRISDEAEERLRSLSAGELVCDDRRRHSSSEHIDDCHGRHSR